MRKIRFPKIRAPRAPASHAAPGRATRTPEPRYKGTHRGTPVVSGAAGTGIPKPPTARSRGRALPQRMSPSDLPNREGRRPATRPSPRARFGEASTEQRVNARVSYERAQRAEKHAQQGAAGGKADRRAGTTARRGGPATMGQPKTARQRFKGESTSAEKNTTAKKLHPDAPTVRAAATRTPSALPGYKPPRHSGDPAPERNGRGFAGVFFGPAPSKANK